MKHVCSIVALCLPEAYSLLWKGFLSVADLTVIHRLHFLLVELLENPSRQFAPKRVINVITFILNSFMSS